MPQHPDIKRLLHLAAAANLPGIEESTSYGTPCLKARGKFLARIKEDGVLAIKCPIPEKEFLMQAEPDIYFQTDHYKGYDSFLIHLDKIDDARLMARLAMAWEMTRKVRK